MVNLISDTVFRYIIGFQSWDCDLLWEITGNDSQIIEINSNGGVQFYQKLQL